MAEFAGLVQRLRRLVQTEADRFMNLNALSSQAAARGGSHYNNAIETIAAESGEMPNFQRFRVSSATPFSAPRRREVVLCGFVIGSAEHFSQCRNCLCKCRCATVRRATCRARKNKWHIFSLVKQCTSKYVVSDEKRTLYWPLSSAPMPLVC